MNAYIDEKPKTKREADSLIAAFFHGVRWVCDKNAMRVTAEEVGNAAKERYPTPTKVEYTTLEDPEFSSWYWRVKDGELQVNFIHETVDMWEAYSPNNTPGLLPTPKRCEIWLKLYAGPSRLVPIP